MTPTFSQAERLLRWTIPWVALAAVLAGSVFWLRRVGWLQAEEYWFAHFRWLQWFNEQVDQLAAYRRVVEFNNSIQTLSWPWTLTKWPKQLVLLTLVAIVLSQWRQWRIQRPMSWLGIGLLGLGVWSALGAVWSGAWLALIAGSRSFVVWTLGLFGTTLASAAVLRTLARTLAWLLVVQGFLVAIELQRGLLLYSVYLFDRDVVRVVGSFNLPASLGSFAVVAWFAAYCWGELRPRTLLLLGFVLIFVLVPNGSAVAWVALALGAVALVMARLQRAWRIGLLLLMLPMLMLLWQSLPGLTGRYEVQNSLWGRIQPVHEYAAEHLSTTELLFGVGFGQGTNALGAQNSSPTITIGGIPDRPVGDSLPAALFWQVGLVGLALAYAWMGLALRADPRSRPVGIAIFVASVAVNITELFPVNIVLGFWLAHAARLRDDDDAHV